MWKPKFGDRWVPKPTIYETIYSIREIWKRTKLDVVSEESLFLQHQMRCTKALPEKSNHIVNQESLMTQETHSNRFPYYP